MFTYINYDFQLPLGITINNILYKMYTHIYLILNYRKWNNKILTIINILLTYMVLQGHLDYQFRFSIFQLNFWRFFVPILKLHRSLLKILKRYDMS